MGSTVLLCMIMSSHMLTLHNLYTIHILTYLLTYLVTYSYLQTGWYLSSKAVRGKRE